MIFKLQGLDHIAITVRDVRASAAWYQDVLGLERVHEDVWGDCPAVVAVGTTAIALFPVDLSHGEPRPRPGRETLAMRHFAFRVDRQNFEAAKRDLASRGIALTEQHHGIAESVYFHDPDGHEVEITTYEL